MTITNSYALLISAGTTRFQGRVQLTKGADVASANDLTLGTDGNIFEITGTTTINGIATSGWRSGSVVTLLFGTSLTVKHNTAPSAGFAKILLAGAVDFSATANDSLMLTYDGTNWRQIGGAVV